MVYSFYRFERVGPGFMWFARVPSHSNIADAPSRGRLEVTARQFKATIVQGLIPDEAIKELMKMKLDTMLG